MSVVPSFADKAKLAIENESFVKLSLGNYKGKEVDLKNIYIKPAFIKRGLKLSYTYRYKTRDIVKNYTISEGLDILIALLDNEGFRIATLFTTNENVICEANKKGEWHLKTNKATATKVANLSHDVQKERKVKDTSKRYLKELRLTDEEGNVFKNAQDKWRQINHYIELLNSSLDNLPKDKKLEVVDMGAGKGYLTFALHDYLTTELKREVHTVGVEYRDDLVELCNKIAKNSSFDQLEFVQGTIEDYTPTQSLDILIALHACDTATDDAIYKGIQHQAELIVVAPCCHKQVRRELEKVKAKNDLDFLTKHGIFLERHAEMLTDGIRALLLEYFGYQTKVMQFISDAHTPKNVMIVAVKGKVNSAKQQEIKTKMESLKAYFGLDFQYLEKLTGI